MREGVSHCGYFELDRSYAIANGALLLNEMFFSNTEKLYKLSFMPHVGSLDLFDWSGIMKSLNINYNPPKEDPLIIIEEIKKSEVLLTEAMHGAIAVDALEYLGYPSVFIMK